MEKPHYGRTGLLASRLSGLPVTQSRLVTAPTTAGAAATSRPLKWYPSLLTIPQQLLDALRREEEGEGDEDAIATGAHHFSTDASLTTYLRLATVAECLVQHWRQSTPPPPSSSSRVGPSRPYAAALYQQVVAWGCEHVRTHQPTKPAKPASFFVPSYKLLVMKDEGRVAEYANLTGRSVWLLGKEPVVNDIPLDHPSCSAQHAALEMRFMLVDEAPLLAFVAAHTATDSTTPVAAAPSYTRDVGELRALCAGLWDILERQQAAAGGDVSSVWSAELLVTDLGSTNRSKLNGAPLPAMEPTTVIETDVLEFGCSTRKYVVLRNA